MIFYGACQLLIEPIKSNFKQTFYRIKFQHDQQISHTKLKQATYLVFSLNSKGCHTNCSLIFNPHIVVDDNLGEFYVEGTFFHTFGGKKIAYLIIV
jgi:hypothetical protein